MGGKMKGIKENIADGMGRMYSTSGFSCFFGRLKLILQSPAMTYFLEKP